MDSWEQWLGGLICVGVALAMAVWLGWPAVSIPRARLARKRRFEERQCVTSDAWFAAFAPEVVDGREALAELLESLGREIGVDWTRFRPDDRFQGTLRLSLSPSWYEDLAEFEYALEQWAKRHRVPVEGLALPDELGSFLYVLAARLPRERSASPSAPPPFLGLS
jgi:hypothetical protein